MRGAISGRPEPSPPIGKSHPAKFGESLQAKNTRAYSCQVGEIENAKNYLKKAFEIDPNWRLQALEDEDLKPLWDSLRVSI